jgi:putative transposase
VFEQDQFPHWLRKLNLSERAENLIQQIRSSNPARLVQSGRGNVSGSYPSRNMGVTIQFESHKNELARIQEFEHASDVIELCGQFRYVASGNDPQITRSHLINSRAKLKLWHDEKN